MSGTALEVQDVSVAFDDTPALTDVNLALDAGQVLAVLGPSGSGKSTLLRVIAGLQRPDAGRVLIDGRDVTEVPTHRRGAALMFQDGQLFSHLDVAANIAYPLRRRRWRSPRISRRVSELLEIVGLPGVQDRRPATLSGGQQQRVALARALAAEPGLLLLDEPLSALDRSLRDRLGADLRGILTATGTTALMVTHDHDEAFTLADRMAVLDAGRVVQQGPVAQVWRRPVDADVARFLGCTAVVTGPDAAALLPGATALGLRPRALQVDPDGPIAAEVVTAVQVADGLRLRVRLPGGASADAVGEGVADAAQAPDPGAAVRLRVAPGSLALLPAP